jgi:hypothetical protein
MNSFRLRHFAVIVITIVLSLPVFGNPDPKPSPEYYQIRVYHFANAEQEKLLDEYISQAWIPYLHKAGIKSVGAFKALANDTVADKRLFVFFSASSLDKLAGLPAQLQKDSGYARAARNYMTAAWNQPPFVRMENIVLKAFRLHLSMELPALKGPKKDRVYELRSYEGPTELLYNSKVHMFNEGGEISLFDRLDFNPVFYAEVLSGSRMPNLMYMTSFENMAERDAHWKVFFADPLWKKISAMPEYQHTVSKAEVMFLAAKDYSDF